MECLKIRLHESEKKGNIETSLGSQKDQTLKGTWTQTSICSHGCQESNAIAVQGHLSNWAAEVKGALSNWMPSQNIIEVSLRFYPIFLALPMLKRANKSKYKQTRGNQLSDALIKLPDEEKSANSFRASTLCQRLFSQDLWQECWQRKQDDRNVKGSPDWVAKSQEVILLTADVCKREGCHGYFQVNKTNGHSHLGLQSGAFLPY